MAEKRVLYCFSDLRSKKRKVFAKSWTQESGQAKSWAYTSVPGRCSIAENSMYRAIWHVCPSIHNSLQTKDRLSRPCETVLANIIASCLRCCVCSSKLHAYLSFSSVLRGAMHQWQVSSNAVKALRAFGFSCLYTGPRPYAIIHRTK